MLSYWEKQSFQSYDHIIIGAGIVGLSTALELRQLYPQSSILVMDRAPIPSGASTRNAGFACMGSLSELIDDAQNMSLEEQLQLFEWRKQGLEILRARIRDNELEYKEEGSHELLEEHELSLLDQIPFWNQQLQQITGTDIFEEINPGYIAKAGLDIHRWKAVIKVNGEGMLHSGRMMQRLLKLIGEHHIEYRTGCEVTAFEEEGQAVHVSYHDKWRQEMFPLSAGHLFICTNAFTTNLLPDADVLPGRGQVMVTTPISGLSLRGIYHFDKGYYYFRELHGRVLLGGARNLAKEEETTTQFGLNNRISEDLLKQLQQHILPAHTYEIAHQWSGIMAFGTNKFPIVQRRSARIFAAYRMGGMGVALGSRIAQMLCSMISSDSAE